MIAKRLLRDLNCLDFFRGIKYDDLLNWHFAIQVSRPGRLEGLSIIFFQMQSTSLVLRMALFVVITTTANLNTLFCDCIQFS